ncbi:MAG: hypothetical protein WA049_08440 [Ferribacterium limneticum]
MEGIHINSHSTPDLLSGFDGAAGKKFTSSATKSKASHLIADPAQRQIRAEEKRRLILRFLRDEIWTNTEVAAELCGIGYAGAHSVLKSMQKLGLTTSSECFIPSARGSVKTVLHGITSQGMAYAWDLDEEPERSSPWEPSKTNPLFVPHQIATQKTRIKAEQLGWQHWKPARSLMRIGLPKVPDGVALSPDGQYVAIEVEREIKTDKRYEAVVGAYIAHIKTDQRWARVDYLCPDGNFAARLARIFGRLSQLRLEGKAGQETKTGALTQAHLDRFRFYTLADWPDGDFVSAKLKVKE